jgi:hypothetical protein
VEGSGGAHPTGNRVIAADIKEEMAAIGELVDYQDYH